MEEFKGNTNEELETIRDMGADNAYVANGIFQRATRELDRRHKKLIEDSLKQSHQNIAIVSHGKNAKITGNTFVSGDSNRILDKGDQKSLKDIPLWVKWCVATVSILGVAWAVFIYVFPNPESIFYPFEINCPKFKSQPDAQRYFQSRGGSVTNNIDDLDRDHDGLACE